MEFVRGTAARPRLAGWLAAGTAADHVNVNTSNFSLIAGVKICSVNGTTI